jgi:hypothetical protein
MVTIVSDNHGCTIGYIESDNCGGFNAICGSTYVAKWDIGRNITKNYITGEEVSGDTLRSCLNEYKLSR